MGAAGTVMHGCVKVDDRGRGQMLGCGSCVGDRCRRMVVGMHGCVGIE